MRSDDVFGEVVLCRNELPEGCVVVWSDDDGFFKVLLWTDRSYRMAAFADTAEIRKQIPKAKLLVDDDFSVYWINTEPFLSLEAAKKGIPIWDSEINQRILSLL